MRTTTQSQHNLDFNNYFLTYFKCVKFNKNRHFMEIYTVFFQLGQYGEMQNHR